MTDDDAAFARDYPPKTAVALAAEFTRADLIRLKYRMGHGLGGDEYEQALYARLETLLDQALRVV